ncbi:MAG: hypothetical protein U0768_13210 [Anaerolineae bacterium]
MVTQAQVGHPGMSLAQTIVGFRRGHSGLHPAALGAIVTLRNPGVPDAPENFRDILLNISILIIVASGRQWSSSRAALTCRSAR